MRRASRLPLPLASNYTLACTRRIDMLTHARAPLRSRSSFAIHVCCTPLDAPAYRRPPEQTSICSCWLECRVVVHVASSCVSPTFTSLTFTLGRHDCDDRSSHLNAQPQLVSPLAVGGGGTRRSLLRIHDLRLVQRAHTSNCGRQVEQAVERFYCELTMLNEAFKFCDGNYADVVVIQIMPLVWTVSLQFVE